MMYASTATNVAQTVAELPDIVGNLLLLLSDKEKTVITKRFNINGIGKFTLEDIGQEFSVTRERVRQIEKNALAKIRRNIFNTSLRHLHEFSTKVVKENGGLVREDNLFGDLAKVLPEGFTFDQSCVHLALVLHDSLECIGNTINFHPYVRDRAIPDYSLKHVSNNLVNQLYKYGNVKNLTKVHFDLKEVFEEVNFDLLQVKSLIEIDKRLILLDEELVGLLEWRHVQPRTLRDKILYILRKDSQPMHFGKIAEKIEDAKFDSRPINIQAVHNELIRHDHFVLIGRGIYALEEWGYQTGTVANVIERVLLDKGELSQEDVIDLVLKQRQVKKITIVLALKNNGKFERVGRKRYKLKSAVAA